jgi:hypothetical protein
MRVEAIRQCDATIGGQRKALFPGQRYDLPEEVVLQLSGHVRVISDGTASVKVVGRPRAKR